MALSVRIGTVPILWNNDDVPELTPPVPFEQVIAQMARAGFEGTELGTNYPRNPTALRGALGREGLTLTGGYFCSDYTDPARHAEIFESARRLAGFLAEAGARYVVAADVIHPARSKVAGRVKGEDGQRYPAFRAFVDALQGLARIADRAGLQLVFHNHAGSYVETPAELDQLLASTDPLVGLCLDTGHCLVGGGDPVQVIRRWGQRLRYVHLKDVSGAALKESVREELDFFGALRRRVFTEVGTGMLDLRGVLAALSERDYRGWLVCEQDTTWRSPLESATLARRNLAAALEVNG